MDVTLLTSLGLNDTQILVYKTLLENGPLAPPSLADRVGIKRQTAYAVLDQLVAMELVLKRDINKKLIYQTQHPVILEKIARKRQDEADASRRLLTANMPSLMQLFYKNTESPGVRFYQGIEQIESIYEDMLRTKDTIYVVRSIHDVSLLSMKYYDVFKKKKVQLGIKTELLNPEVNPNVWNDETDKKLLTNRTQIPQDSYDAPVEISVYGDNIAIISFGQEAIGTIISSKQISGAMRQIFMLAKQGALAVSAHQ